MNILYLTLARLEKIKEQGIANDLLKEFKNEGHNLYVVCSRQKKLGLETKNSMEEGINVLRVKVGNITKTNKLEKGISTVRIEGQYLEAIKKYFPDVKFDLILYSTPPITFEKVIRYIKKRDGAKSYLLLKDIFPQNAVDLNMLKKGSFVYRYFKNKENKLYKQSDFIGCMSQANVDYILENNKYIDSNNIEVCPNSINPITIEKDKSEIKRIREKYNIPLDKAVLIYGGNLGKPQGINFLIECLEAHKQNTNVYFVIAGSGTEFNKLHSYFEKETPVNAQLFKQLPKEDYEILANSCDIGLIFLDHRFTIPNFPSRLLSYMQASMPVLAATDPNTDIGQVIEKGEFGYWCESNNVESFSNQLEKLTDASLREKMGNNAKKYLEKNYTARHSYEIIMSHFK